MVVETWHAPLYRRAVIRKYSVTQFFRIALQYWESKYENERPSPLSRMLLPGVQLELPTGNSRKFPNPPGSAPGGFFIFRIEIKEN